MFQATVDNNSPQPKFERAFFRIVLIDLTKDVGICFLQGVLTVLTVLKIPSCNTEGIRRGILVQKSVTFAVARKAELYNVGIDHKSREKRKSRNGASSVAVDFYSGLLTGIK